MARRQKANGRANGTAGSSPSPAPALEGDISTSSLPAVIERGPALPASAEVVERGRAYARAAYADNTLRAYGTAWRDFSTWAAGRGFDPLPCDPAALAEFLTVRADAVSLSSLVVKLAAIKRAHADKGFNDPSTHPVVSRVWAGIRKTKGVAPQRQKKPAEIEVIRKMVADLGERPADVRDRALLLIGLVSACRRSELVGLNVEDLTETGDGLVGRIRRSKTDQEGAGREVALPYGSNPSTCPVRAWRAWLALIGSEGPAFRQVTKGGRILPGRLSDRAVALIVKRYAVRVGLDPADFAGHSLRAGFVTSADAIDGVSDRDIMAQTGHKSVATLTRYVRHGSLFRRTAATKIGL